MKRRLFVLTLSFLTLTALCFESPAQFGKKYDGPDDPAADPLAERDGFMNGNNVLLYFRNTTELSDCCNLGYWVSRWPNDYSGSKMHDGISILLGARVFVENDSMPVTDRFVIAARNDLDTLYYCQSSFREFMDKDPTRTIEWALYPVFGYFNIANPNPAMSNKPDSWPPAGWPASGDQIKWPGVWNGRFGLGQTRADLETYFVANDAQDQENLEADSPAKYFPRPGVFIGDKGMVSVQNGLPWGGLGLRVEVRGFQWKNPEAADCIFWEYTIANISDYDLPEMYFGYEIDNAVGGEEYDYGSTAADDIAYYDTDLEMCFSWDLDGEMIGGGGVPGCMGIAFLESPGVSTDQVDNDQDGVIDEQRDNEAGPWVSSLTGIDNLAAWNHYRGITDPADTSTIRPHFLGDEDQDWQDGLDANGNGIYDDGENPGDDVGTDGSGPWDLDYPGYPDADGSECNHRPDLLPGVGSEPNFAYTDIGESDMLGLTSFKYLLEWAAGWGGPRTQADDQSIWYWLTEEEPLFHEYQQNPQNFIEQFAAGVFTMYQGRTERISLSELHALERLHEQSAPPFSAPALFKLKQVVQAIYESDYQFAQPPVMPSLTATPGDGKVVLSWDDISERFTREPLLGHVNDFEGYKLFKSTDPFMSDDKKITDGFGTATLIQPIFQCDRVDGKKGFTNFGYRNGAGYYLGEDSGIRNYYVDTDVENGRTYYYVLVAYDYGIKNEDIEVGPTENTYTIDVARDESISDVTRNVAIVTPHQKAAGYIPPQIVNLSSNNSFGKNTVTPEVVVESLLKHGHEYKVKFGVDSLFITRWLNHGLVYRDTSLLVFDVTAGDSLVYFEDGNNYAGSNFQYYKNEIQFWNVFEEWVFNTEKELVTAQFDGLVLKFRVPALIATYDSLNSDWITGGGNIKITQPSREDVRFFPYDYDIIFTDEPVYNGTIKDSRSIFNEDLDPIPTNYITIQEPLPFYVQTRSVTDSLGNPLQAELVVHDLNYNEEFDWLTDRILVGFVNTAAGSRQGRWAGLAFVFDFKQAQTEAELPQAGDVFHVAFKRGFVANDAVTFTVQVPDSVDDARLATEMENIGVVPNPYVVTNTLEPAVGNWEKNQDRRIMFTNIPAECTIKIFTVTGLLVEEIEVNNAVSQRVNDWDTNSAANGTAFWDLRTKDGLEIAAGYYLYHIESHRTGKVKMGKLAVIK